MAYRLPPPLISLKRQGVVLEIINDNPRSPQKSATAASCLRRKLLPTSVRSCEGAYIPTRLPRRSNRSSASDTMLYGAPRNSKERNKQSRWAACAIHPLLLEERRLLLLREVQRTDTAFPSDHDDGGSNSSSSLASVFQIESGCIDMRFRRRSLRHTSALIEHILSQRNATQAQSPKVPTRRQSVEQEKERQQSPHKNEAHQITADFILNKMQVLDFAGQRESPPCKPTRRCSDEHQRYMTQQAIAQVLDEMEDENDWKKDDDDDENYNEEGILEKKSANDRSPNPSFYLIYKPTLPLPALHHTTGSDIQTGHTSSRAALRRASFRPNFTPEMTDTALAQALVELDDQSESSRDTCPHCVALVPAAI
uniref:Uncharacterized protein n=1 Tax=Phaeodactylum tricornutum TaxID=2850 RepID=A0A8J9X8S8_PHATR